MQYIYIYTYICIYIYVIYIYIYIHTYGVLGRKGAQPKYRDQPLKRDKDIDSIDSVVLATYTIVQSSKIHKSNI